MASFFLTWLCVWLISEVQLWREQVYFYSSYLWEKDIAGGVLTLAHGLQSMYVVVDDSISQAGKGAQYSIFLDISELRQFVCRLAFSCPSLITYRSLILGTSIICLCFSFPFVSAAESFISLSSCLNGKSVLQLVVLLLLRTFCNQDIVLGTR